jgi:dTDP-4-dehydrorhamnose 3,5-epimerase-like enzyme
MKLVMVPTFSDGKGELSVLESIIPFEMKRVYYIYNATGTRGGHMHKITRQAMVCVHGRCSVYMNNGKDIKDFLLDSPDKCLLIEPEDWHSMYGFSDDCVLVVLASELYNENDYVSKEYT